MMILAHANELVTAYIALEIASFLFILWLDIIVKTQKELKQYLNLVLGSFIGAFYLLGVVLVYGATQTTKFGWKYLHLYLLQVLMI